MRWRSGCRPGRQGSHDRKAVVGRASVRGSEGAARQRAGLQRRLVGSLRDLGPTERSGSAPDAADLDHFGLSGFAREALADLREMAESGEEALAARDALALLYRLAEPRA